ncbi:MAG: acetylxylan esterase [Clostridia bacterium]|nr:acetylxylan esterase [Clostridia bacterium]
MKCTYDYERELFREVKPSMRYVGGDLKVWQKAAREKLGELLGLDRMLPAVPDLRIEWERERESYTEMRFTFRSEPGYYVPAHLLLPKGVKKPPLMICLQGHSPGMYISLGVVKQEKDELSIRGGNRDFCIRAVREGYAAICMEQRSFGELKNPNKELDACLEPAMTALLMGRTTLGERVWDVSRLIDVAEKYFADKVDVKTICLMGNSGGGTATAYAAALEDRITLAMPSSAICTFRDSIGAMHHCSFNYVPRIGLYVDMGDLIAMAAPKYYVQVNGAEDKIFPLVGAIECFEQGRKAYDFLGCSDRLTHVIGEEGHRFYADKAWRVVHAYLGR